MELSVIIVSYNVKHYLRQCLTSVWRALRGVEGEVFVVDNASADGSVAYLRAAFPAADYPALHIIAGTRNVGFGRANNLALARATGDYVLFLNPDTLLGEETLREALAFARSHEALGALGVRMLNDRGAFAPESRRGRPTPWAAFCKMSGLVRLFPRSRAMGSYYMGWLDVDRSAPIEIVSGAFMFCSHRALRTTGGFDEAFFMYGEDIDLSYRLLSAGYTNYYLPTPILHYKGESTHKNSYRYVHVFYEAMYLFFRKHYRHASPFLAVPIKAAIALRAAVALTGRATHALSRFLWPQGGAKQPTFCYAGSHADAFSRLAEAAGLRQVPADRAREATITAYDAMDNSYADILNRLMRSDHKSHVGIFYPREGTLVTGGDVYTSTPSEP